MIFVYLYLIFVISVKKNFIVGYINEGVNMWLLVIIMVVLWIFVDFQDRQIIIDNISGYKMERVSYVIWI